MFVMDTFLTKVSASSIFSKLNEIPEVVLAKEIEKYWRAWKDEFRSISNRNTYIKISRVKDRYNAWINTEIIKTMNQRYYTYDNAVNAKSVLLWECRNKVASMIRDAKKDYFDNLSNEYKNDTRRYWK